MTLSCNHGNLALSGDEVITCVKGEEWDYSDIPTCFINTGTDYRFISDTCARFDCSPQQPLPAYPLPTQHHQPLTTDIKNLEHPMKN